MTALIVCEQCNVLDRVRIPQEAVGIEGSSIYLQAGEILTVQDLLYGLMLHSGNDAAVALAIYCGGTVEGFAELMNDKARSLQMYDSRFVNPNGLDHPEHYSTARDMAKLAAYAMKNPIFAQTVSTKTIRSGQRVFKNHNKLLWQLDGADGVKTGYTRAAGRILVSSASRQGRRLVAVTINAPSDWSDHVALMENGFAQFSEKQIIKAGQCLGTASLIGGEQDTVVLVATEDFFYPTSKKEQLDVQLGAHGIVFAPVCKGQDAGYAYVLLDGQVVGKVALAYGQTVEQNTTPKSSRWKWRFGKDIP
jgi:D-alanyl-D-alanine carboxypeptidase